MTFKDFVNNLNRAHDRGSFSLALVYATAAVFLIIVLVGIMVTAPMVGTCILFTAAVARVIYAGLKGR